jgi:hypothetical protein
VVVKDAKGQPVAQVAVTFAVTAGGGSVTGGAVTTGADGVAAAGGWTLGTQTGVNTLTATVSGLTPVTFTVTGVAGAPAALLKVAGDSQTVPAGAAVTIAPTVRVKDKYDNPVAGASVRFTPRSASGQVGADTVLETDTTGTAAVSAWTLDTVPGTQWLDVAVTGLDSVTFSADALDPCLATAYAFDDTVTGQLRRISCKFVDGTFIDRYAMHVAQQTLATFRMHSADFDPKLLLGDAAGNVLGLNDNAYDTTGVNGDAGLRVLLAPGDYLLGANESVMGDTGSYTLRTDLGASEDVGPCGTYTTITPGVTTAQSISTSDCQSVRDSAGSVNYGDEIDFYLSAGQTATVSMMMPADSAYMWLNLGDSALAYADTRNGSAAATITYQAQADGVYWIFAAASHGGTGPYTLTYTVSGSGSATLATRLSTQIPSATRAMRLRDARWLAASQAMAGVAPVQPMRAIVPSSRVGSLGEKSPLPRVPQS